MNNARSAIETAFTPPRLISRTLFEEENPDIVLPKPKDPREARGEGPFRRVFNNYGEFGVWATEKHPELEEAFKGGMSYEDIGRNLKEKDLEYSDVQIVESYSDVDYTKAFTDDFSTDWGEVAEEEIEGLGEMYDDPVGTLGALPELALAGIDELTEWTRKKRADAKNSLVEGGFPAHLADALIDDMALPSFVSQKGREDVRAVGRAMKHRVSPAEVQRNPLQMTSDLAQTIGSLFIPGAGGPLKTALRAPAMAKKTRLARGITKGAELALDPAGAVTEVPLMGFRALKKTPGEGAARAGGFVEEHKLAQGDSGLLGELSSAGLGFTTSMGKRFIQNLGRRADTVLKSPGGKQEKWVDIFRDTRAMDPEVGTADVLNRAYRAMDRWRDDMKTRYTTMVEKNFQLPRGGYKGGEKRMRTINIKEIYPELKAQLENFGFRVVPDTRKGFEGKLQVQEIPGKTIPADATAVTEFGGDRAIIRSQFERFLNTQEVVQADEFHLLRLLLDDNITKMGAAAEGPSARTSSLLTDLRNTVANQLEFELPDDYAIGMAKYSEELELLRRADRELGLKPGKIIRAKERGEGIIVEERVDLTENDIAIGRMSRVFSEAAQDAQKLPLLEMIQKFGGDETIIPAMMGMQSAPIFGSGLVVRSEISQAGRTAAMILLGGAGLEAGLLTMPAFVLFSPRLMSEVIVTVLPKSKELADKLRHASELFKKVDAKTGGKLRKQALISGANITQYLERVEQDAGVDIGESFDVEYRSGMPAIDLNELARITGFQAAKQDVLGAR